jgi:hypothetical protein
MTLFVMPGSLLMDAYRSTFAIGVFYFLKEAFHHMKRKVIVLVVVSIVIAILLATALTSFTSIPDSALAQLSPSPLGEGRGEVSSRPANTDKNYLPIIFLNSATAGGAWVLAGNAGTNWNSDFLGTTDNMTLTLRVSNTVAYRIVPAANSLSGFAPNIIGGSSANQVASGLLGATIGGGGSVINPNVITGTGGFAFIGGGSANTVSGANSAIGGGNRNTVSGANSAIGGGYGNAVGGGNSAISGGFGNAANGDNSVVGGGAYDSANGSYSFIGGGYANTANGPENVIAGGYANTASGLASAVGGGYANTAAGDYATVAGGYFNTASGTDSFAAGNRARALHSGTFVWADSTNVAFASTANNQFLIRANGNVGINTTTPTRTLDVNGKIGVFDGGGHVFYAGIATELNAQMIDFGINEDSLNRFGGAYDPTWQGGLLRVDTRGTQDLFQFQGRMEGSSAPMTELAGLSSTGVFNAAGGFRGQCLSSSSSYFSTNTTRSCNMDVAEGFAATQLTAPGDLVALVTSATGTPTVRKSSGAYDDLVVGVVSQNPGLVFDNGKTQIAGDNSNLITADKTVVALVGRVNVKISTENGAIHIGDALTSSSKPGIAMKATQAGKIIGYAMENANADGTLLALVQPGNYVPQEQLDALKRNAELEAWVVAQDARLAALESQSAALGGFAWKDFVAVAVVAMMAMMLVRRTKP